MSRAAFERYYVYGGTPTPNAILLSDGTRAVRGWWPCAEELGVVSESSASVSADPDTWDSNLAVTVTGSGPSYSIRATTANSRHYCFHSAPTNVILAYNDIALVCRAAGSQQWIRVRTAAGSWANFDVINGVEGNSVGTGTHSISVVAGVATIRFRARSTTDGPFAIVELLVSDSSLSTPPAYAGSTSDGIDDAVVALIQHRSSGVADQSLTAAGAPRGADLLQATPGNQPLWGKDGWLNDLTPPGSSNGRPVLVAETGRLVTLYSTNADVVGLATGDDPDYALAGVCAVSGTNTGPVRWSGGGSIQDVPLYVNGGELSYYRHDGVAVAAGNYGSGLAASFATLGFVALIRAGGVNYLYRGGSMVASATPADIGSATMNACYTPRNVSAGEARFGGLAIYAVDGTKTHAQIYAELRAAHARSIAAFGVAA